MARKSATKKTAKKSRARAGARKTAAAKKASAKKAGARKGAAKSAAKKKSAAKSTRANGARRTTREPEAIALLKQDHRRVEELFEEFEEASSSSEKRSIAREICLELVVHAKIEEEIFYPAVKDVVEDDIYTEAHVEHDGAKVLIAEIMEGDPRDEFYDARVKVLSEMIKHHVKEEEQRDGMFAQARKSDIDFDELGERLAQRKEDLMRIMKRNGIPAPETRTLHGAELNYQQPVA